MSAVREDEGPGPVRVRVAATVAVEPVHDRKLKIFTLSDFGVPRLVLFSSTHFFAETAEEVSFSHSSRFAIVT